MADAITTVLYSSSQLVCLPMRVCNFLHSGTLNIYSYALVIFVRPKVCAILIFCEMVVKLWDFLAVLMVSSHFLVVLFVVGGVCILV